VHNIQPYVIHTCCLPSLS